MDALLTAYFVLLCAALCFYAAALPKGALFVKIILAYLLLHGITGTIAAYLVKVVHVRNNLFLFHILVPLEYPLLATLYYKVFQGRLLKKAVAFSVPLFVGICIFLSLFVQDIRTNNSYASILESILMIVWTLCFFRELMLLQQVTLLYRYPMFWISVGLLFYFTGSLLIEGPLNYLMARSMQLALRVYQIEYLFKYLLLVLLIVGVRCTSLFRERFSITSHPGPHGS